MTERSSSENFSAGIIDSVGDGVIAMDMAGIIRLMNPAAEEITGISRRLAQGNLFSTLFVGEELLMEMVEKTSSTGMTVSDHENVILRKLGQETPVSVTTSPLLLNTGDQTGVILVLRDLTNIRNLEQAVRHSDRIAALGTLAVGLAHEIKNPLGGIKGAAQLLEQELPEDSELRDYTRVMIKEVRRVNRIVEELLDLSSPRKLQLSHVNLHKVLTDIITLQKESAEGTKLVFRQQFDLSIPPLLADEALLTQLFLNLIKNGIEALKDGGILSVATRVISDYSMSQKGERRSRVAAIEITDNGPGMEKEQVEEIFTPFFTTKSRGTGLGLAICQKIVSEHNGMIRVDSLPGEGTTFTVMLPLAGC